MRILLFLGILIGVYLVITVVLKWCHRWIFRADDDAPLSNEKSKTQKEMEDFINGKS